MASNQFKNSTYSGIGTSDTSVYLAPSGKKSLVLQFDVINTLSGVAPVYVDLFLYDSSKSTKIYIRKNMAVAVGESVEGINFGKKIVLESNDYLGVKSSDAASIDVLISVLEDVN